jgi:nucleoid-associated protein YgaU
MSASPSRCLAVAATATAITAGLVAWLAPMLVEPATTFDQWLVRVCAGAATLSAVWLWAVTMAVVVEAVRGTTRPTRGVPTSLRRLVLGACGVAVAVGLVVPAQATPGDLHRDRRPAAVLAGLPLPDRAVALPGAALVSTGPVRDRRPEGPASVVVRPGDSLWDLAEEHLGDPRRWPELYALNRAVIGADPDLIRPAQRLRLPD